MATIRKRGERYQVQIRRTGFPTITKSFLLLADAKEWANLQERQADRGELGPDRKELERITLADLITRYLAEVVPLKRHGETDTFALNMVLRHNMAKKRLADLSAVDFFDYRDERLKDVSPATLKRQLTPLKHMFRHAYGEWDIPIRENPLTKLKFPGADKRRERRLHGNELKMLLHAGKKTRNKLVMPVICLALETGMRRGEILALRYRDVDIERGTTIVRESKNGHSRTIPLTVAATAIMTDAIARIENSGEIKNDRLFPMTPIALRQAWDRLMERADIDDLNFHDLRHEAISRFFELGLTVPEVASISGHRDMRMLFRYAHENHASVRAKLD